MPKVSVIVPCYNSSNFIKRTINSVLFQTFKDWELILVDDCSIDNTVEIIEEYVKRDPRIKLFKTEKNSGGPAHPKNVGLKEAKGEYIAFLDHDDEWLPEKLEKQLEVFEKSDNPRLGLVTCSSFLVDRDNKVIGKISTKNKKEIFPEILIRNPIHSNSSVLIKKEVLKLVGERDENLKYSEDYDMWIRIAKQYDFFFIEKPLFNYRLHKNNTTRITLISKKIENMEYIFNKHLYLYTKYKYIHIGYFRLGVMNLISNNKKGSQNNFIKSINKNRLFAPSYIGYLLTLTGSFGKKLIKFFIFIYRIIKGKKIKLNLNS